MIPGPFSHLNSRMLDIHANPKSLDVPRCAAPKDIFSDYNHVMALLRDEIVRTAIHTDHDEREYRKKPHAREVATKSANTYSGLVIRKSGSKRKSQKPKPYDRTPHTKVSTETYSPALQSSCVVLECCGKGDTDSRHWRTCHIFKEAKSILEGRLAIGEGTSITSKEQLKEITSQIQCPYCGALITRSDSMKRHIKQNCKAFEDPCLRMKD